MKCIVETSGDFGLLNTNKDFIEAHRPTVTEFTSFVEERIGNGEVSLLARGLPDEALDADFVTFFNEAEGDTPLAVESFCAALGVNTTGQELTSAEIKKLAPAPKKTVVIPEHAQGEKTAPVTVATDTKTEVKTEAETDKK